MKCNEARRFMSPYLDSELGSTKTFEVSDHLQHCPECERRFNSERAVDDLMRRRLEHDPMPAELWSRISQNVTTPLWVRRLRSGPALALAAAIVLAFVGTTMVLQSPPAPELPWVVSVLKDSAPGNQPFVGTSASLAAAKETLRADYGLRFASTVGSHSTGLHHLALVSVSKHIDAMGREFAEVRLNCCGNPVVLVLARPTEGRWPQPLNAADTADAARFMDTAGLRVATRQLPGVRAIAVGHHPVGDVLASLQIISA